MCLSLRNWVTYQSPWWWTETDLWKRWTHSKMGNGLEIGSRWMGKISPELEKLEEMITREAQFNQIFKAPDHRKTKHFNCLTKWPPWKSSAWSRSNLERKHGKMFHITWCGDFGRNVSLNKFIDRILHVKKRSDSAANWLQEMEQGKWNSSHQTKKIDESGARCIS